MHHWRSGPGALNKLLSSMLQKLISGCRRKVSEGIEGSNWKGTELKAKAATLGCMMSRYLSLMKLVWLGKKKKSNQTPQSPSSSDSSKRPWGSFLRTYFCTGLWAWEEQVPRWWGDGWRMHLLFGMDITFAVGSNGLGADMTLDRCCAAVRSIGILALSWWGTLFD